MVAIDTEKKCHGRMAACWCVCVCGRGGRRRAATSGPGSRLIRTGLFVCSSLPTKTTETTPRERALFPRCHCGLAKPIILAIYYYYFFFATKKHVRENELPAAPFWNAKALLAAWSAPRRPLSNETKKIGGFLTPCAPGVEARLTVCVCVCVSVRCRPSAPAVGCL